MLRRRNLQAQLAAKQVSGISLAVFTVFTAAAIGAALLLDAARQPVWLIVSVLFALMAPSVYLLFALKVANEWEKAIVLRAGKFRALRGPGLFGIIPILDSIPIWVGHRVMVTPFNAEKTLTKEATQ